VGPVPNRRLAREIYKLLVSLAGADDREDVRERFVSYLTEDENPEWRFCGSLGFGGKFHASNSKWWVSCYREDETPERLEVIRKLNKALEVLKTTNGQVKENEQ
jgi:hypothetical protein